jgi:hypothetical protein
MVWGSGICFIVVGALMLPCDSGESNFGHHYPVIDGWNVMFVLQLQVLAKIYFSPATLQVSDPHSSVIKKDTQTKPRLFSLHCASCVCQVL